MIVRYALFEGEIHSGCERAFRQFVEERLVPLWTSFPGAEKISVHFGTARDDGAPPYAMALAIRYPDIESCDRALQSDARFRSREVTRELLTMFTGKVHHHVFECRDYAPA